MPLSASHEAGPHPQRATRKCDDASSGTRPIFTKRAEILALRAATSRSKGRTIVRPMPMAGPLMAATSGNVDRQKRTQSAAGAGSDPRSGVAPPR